MSYLDVLSNPSYNDDTFKIGYTDREVGVRAIELYGTSVPTPFEIEAKYQLYNAACVEAEVHSALTEYRVNGSREFFRCDRDTIGISIEDDRRERRHEDHWRKLREITEDRRQVCVYERNGGRLIRVCRDD
jgi:hypothetical protein